MSKIKVEYDDVYSKKYSNYGWPYSSTRLTWKDAYADELKRATNAEVVLDGLLQLFPELKAVRHEVSTGYGTTFKWDAEKIKRLVDIIHKDEKDAANKKFLADFRKEIAR